MPTRFLILSITLFTTWTSASVPETLQQLCKSALQHHPKIRAAHHRTLAGEYAYQQAIDRYKPRLSIDANFGYDKYDYDYPEKKVVYEDTITQYTVSLTQPIVRLVDWNRIDDAKLRKKATAIQEEDEKAKLLTQIVQTVIELSRLQEIQKLNQKKVEIFAQAYKTIKVKYKLHFSSNPELLQAKQKWMQAKSDLAQINQYLQNRKHQLKLLTGLHTIPSKIYTKQFSILSNKELFNNTHYQALINTMKKSTQIKLYQTYLEIAQNDIKTRKYERYPTLDAKLSYGDTDSTDSIQRTNESRAMLYLNFPFYQGGYVSDRVDEGMEMKEAALADLQNIRLSIQVSIEKDWEDIQNGLETLQAQKVAHQAASAYFKTAVSSYKNGLGSLTDAYLAEADMHDAAIAIINTQAKILTSLVDLYYYAGNISLPNIQRFDSIFMRLK